MRRLLVVLRRAFGPLWRPRPPVDPDKERIRREQREVADRLRALEVEADWRGERGGGR
jgi:hypothetical protein